MIQPTRRAMTVGLAVATLLAACGDDGNDGNDRASRDADTDEPAVQIAAEARTEAGPAQPTPTAPAAPAVEPTGVVVPITALDNSFRPEVVDVAVGDEVVWENRGVNDHNVLYVDGDDWGVEVEGFTPGAVYAHVFSEPGEYRYYCSIHGNEAVGMVGTVVVTG